MRPLTLGLAISPAALLLGLAISGTPAHAGGQYAGDNGSLATQRAGAFVARADDPSALTHNPGALTRLATRQVFLGINLVDYDQSFERSGTYQPEGPGGGDYVGQPYPRVEHQGTIQPVPFVAAGFATERYALAFGVFAPHGYGKREFGDRVATGAGMAPAPQRYDTVSQDALVVLPSVALAVPISERISVGARASYGFARIASRRFAQGLPNREEAPGADTDTTIIVRDDRILTFGAGVHVRASETLELGAAYSAPARVDARGASNPILGDDLRNAVPGTETRIVPLADAAAQCSPGGVEGALATCLDMVLPQTVSVGVRVIARDEAGRELADLELDARWENWAAAEEVRVVVDGQNSATGTATQPTLVRHGYQDVYSVRVGGSRRFGAAGTYLVSVGVGYESAAAPVSWTRLDVDTAERFLAAGGLAIDLGTTRIDLGLSLIDPTDRHVDDMPLGDPSDPRARVQPDVSVPLQGPEAQPHHPFNAGDYASRYVVGSVGLTTSW